jgi:hypothetical protein
MSARLFATTEAVYLRVCLQLASNGAGHSGILAPGWAHLISQNGHPNRLL